MLSLASLKQYIVNKAKYFLYLKKLLHSLLSFGLYVFARARGLSWKDWEKWEITLQGWWLPNPISHFRLGISACGHSPVFQAIVKVILSLAEQPNWPCGIPHPWAPLLLSGRSGHSFILVFFSMLGNRQMSHHKSQIDKPKLFQIQEEDKI